ncbi:hypothetical protein M569_06058, partial [Genlisea aurea]
FSTRFRSPETTDEIVDEVLAAAASQEPSVSVEQICLVHIRNLCASGDVRSAVRLSQTLNGKRICIGRRAYDCMLEAAETQNDVHLLSEIFIHLLASCRSKELNSPYLVVARSLGKYKDHHPDLLSDFVKQVCETRRCRADLTLNRIIHASAKSGHVDIALQVFDHMKKTATQKPDSFTYNIVISILGRLGRIDEMLHEFDSLKKTSNLVPDVVTYNTILNSLRKMGRLDLCLAHFKEMADRGLQPDAITFKALIESLGRSGHIEKALQVFDEMNRNGIRPSVHIYRALVFSLKKMGKSELASKFSADMKKLQMESSAFSI